MKDSGLFLVMGLVISLNMESEGLGFVISLETEDLKSHKQ